jgi:hypothetical protein
VNLKGLIHRKFGEGLTEEELASTVGVSVRAIETILTDELFQGPAIWEQFARASNNSLAQGTSYSVGFTRSFQMLDPS